MSAAREAATRARGATPAASSRSKSKKALAGKRLEPPSPSSQLGKYLGIPQPKRSETTMLLSQFIKLHTRKNPGIKKDGLNEEKLKMSWKVKTGSVSRRSSSCSCNSLAEPAEISFPLIHAVGTLF
ncbi:hypothetical protein MLD38_010435 [Melastoma candidum]|uniref:Uncharacterized protein n=1 Tax=Melastoma candidum TaxID=119954 RepID=A0ACB9QZU1_9MYRT|nr:hypothetical protein MLD38_010435 [Melastoma candidum]